MSIPVILKNQINEKSILKSEEELNEFTSKLTEEFFLFRVYDIFETKYVGYCALPISKATDFIHSTIAHNNHLHQNNKLLSDELRYFKEHCADLEEEVNHLKARCRKLSSENHDLLVENKDMKFTRKYLTSEDAGKRFAQELLGGN